VLNKNLNESVNGSFTINSANNFQTVSAWAMTSSGAPITAEGDFDVQNNQFTYNLPAASAWHFF